MIYVFITCVFFIFFLVNGYCSKLRIFFIESDLFLSYSLYLEKII